MKPQNPLVVISRQPRRGEELTTVQGSFYALPRHHEPAAADPVYGAADLCFKRKVFLILDNLKVHHGKLAAAWLEHHKDKIEVFFLPPYAPEYNPDEYLRKH